MDLAIQALNLDATDFINKPLQRDALEKALERAGERLAIARSEEEQISLEERPAAAVVGVRGNVTGHTIPHLNEAFDKALKMNKPTVLIDFDENASINGAGITGLTELLSRDRDKGMRVVLAGLSSNFKAVFASVGITPAGRTLRQRGRSPGRPIAPIFSACRALPPARPGRAAG